MASVAIVPIELVKIVYNASYGSFCLSDAAVALWGARTGNVCLDRGIDIPRDDPELARIVEEMGKAANGPSAKLQIRELPKGTKYIVREYDHGGEEVKTVDEFDWLVA